MKATFVKQAKIFSGDARIFRIDPPHEGYEYITVSAIDGPWAYETMAFGSDAEGNPATWDSLACVKNVTDHVSCLEELGYELA